MKDSKSVNVIKALQPASCAAFSLFRNIHLFRGGYRKKLLFRPARRVAGGPRRGRVAGGVTRPDAPVKLPAVLQAAVAAGGRAADPADVTSVAGQRETIAAATALMTMFTFNCRR